MHDPRCCAGDGPARTDAGVRSDDEQVRSLCFDNITDLLHVMRTYILPAGLRKQLTTTALLARAAVRL